MRKKLVLITAMVCVLAMGMAACQKADDKGNAGNSTMTAVETLEKVWAAYSEDDKPIVMGGDAEHAVDGAPGAYAIEDVEGIESMFHITADAVAMTDEVASAVHAMNANTFTCSAFHLKDGSQKEDFAASVKESVLGTRWMCGFPEKLVILSVEDEFVISAFGNGDMIELFKTKVTETYGDGAAVFADEIIE